MFYVRARAWGFADVRGGDSTCMLCIDHKDNMQVLPGSGRLLCRAAPQLHLRVPECRLRARSGVVPHMKNGWSCRASLLGLVARRPAQTSNGKRTRNQALTERVWWCTTEQHGVPHTEAGSTATLIPRLPCHMHRCRCPAKPCHMFFGCGVVTQAWWLVAVIVCKHGSLLGAHSFPS